jgi:hypothetical protein
MQMSKREFLWMACGMVFAPRLAFADELKVTISFSDDGTRVLALVSGDGDGGVENGFSLSSRSFSSGGSGSAKVDLGPATPGVYSVRFIRGSDSYAAIVVIGADQSLTVIDGTGNTRNLPGASSDLLTRFWSGFTKERLNSVLGGAIESWIAANAVGGPVLVVVGIITGPLSLAFLAGAVAKAADLFALVIAKVAKSESHDNIITADEVATVKKAVGVVDVVSQLPAILTSDTGIEKAAGAINAGVNFFAESDTVKLGVSFLSDGTGKYMLALRALQKIQPQIHRKNPKSHDEAQ